jgi:hypothetical protein
MDDNGSAVPDAELPGLYRREAERCRQQADVAETIEMRVTLLETAERFEQLAAEQEADRD